MRLYAYRFCPFCRRVRIILAEKGIELDYVETDPKELLPEDVRARIPLDRGVPVLDVREDLILWDSLAIMHWLDAAYPVSLTPSSRDYHAVAESWIGWAPRALYAPLYLAKSGDDEKKRRMAMDGLAKTLARIESRMPDPGADGWLVGKVFTTADIAMAPALATLPEELVAKMGPRLRAYTELLKGRPSIRHVCELDRERPSKAA